MPDDSTFACPKCNTAFAVEPGIVDVAATCPGCSSDLEAHFYPAFYRPMEVGAAPAALTDLTEASCFYHPQKQAVRICDGCGRLICALCSIDLGSQHLCPNCISSGKKKGNLSTLENGRTRYDSIALSLAVFGILTSFFSLVLAPAAIYISVRHWKSPLGLTGGSRARFVAAIVIASISLVVWGGIIGLAIFGASSVPHHHHA